MLSRPRNHEPIPWRHGVVSTPLFTGATVYLGGLGLGLAQDAGATLPLGWIGLGSLTGIAAASASRWIRTRGQTRHRRWFHTGFTATWTTAAYAWINWSAHNTPWTMASAAAVAAGAAALTPFYAIDRGLRADQIADQWAHEAGAKNADTVEWEKTFEDAGARGIQVGKTVPTRGGYKLHLRLNQTPVKQLHQLLPMLEVRKGDLRTGSLRLEPTPIASEAWLHVTTRDVLAESLTLPPDDHPLTINEPLTLGMLESGEPIEILFRQNSILVAGKKGSGKSVLLHVMTAVLTRCTDAVIWMIDLAEGNAAKRWLRPWVEECKDRDGNLIDRPILDWVATTHEEAVRLLNAALAVAEGRSGRMKGGKIRPKPEEPALIVLSDENADLMAWNAQAIQSKTRGVKKGRKAAVDYIDFVQRGTGPNTGGGEIDSQYDTVIGMRFAKKGEGQFVFPDHYGQVDLSQLPGSGAIYILDEERRKAGGLGPERGKVHFANDEDENPDGSPCRDIEDLSVARWDIRPDLDAASQSDAAPYGYADRWSDPQRIGWLLDVLNRPNPHGESTPVTTSAEPAAGGAATGGLGSLTPMRPMEYYVDKAKNQSPDSDTEHERQPQPAASADTPDNPQIAQAIADVLAEVERITEEAAENTGSETTATGQEPADSSAGPEWLTTAIDAIESAGAMGMKPAAIAEMVGRDRKTVRAALKAAADRGELIYRENGPHSVYVHPDHA
ncbi:hypothetical protein [Streptomyces noursei]|uniref:FtsK domain-containing protein n=1 Tax=Streptomyces noursei TaxID=1971 RepID=A0A2N8PKQ6_STRNR|nr:hypothetical protein [Streptomyces noursei]PNE41607.1 hypothetical protein AOB60_13345 [Streptomyces noursei]